MTSVLKRESFVLALTPHGLFRASTATKRWERLKAPPGMPLKGEFASEPESSKLVFFFASRRKKNPPIGDRYGLYLSRDDGASWQLVSERDDCTYVLLHPSGALFAITGGDRLNTGSHAFRSPDLGKTWRDISGTVHGFTSLHPDPDHINLVHAHALGAFAIETFRADDERYHWKKPWTTRHRFPNIRRPSEDFFERSSFGGSYDYSATLSKLLSVRLRERGASALP